MINPLRRSTLVLGGVLLLGLTGCLAEPNEMRWAPAGGAIPQAPPARPAAPQTSPMAPVAPLPMLEDPEAEFVENWESDVWAEDEATAKSKCRDLRDKLEDNYKSPVEFLGVKRRNNSKFFCGFKFEQLKEVPDYDK